MCIRVITSHKLRSCIGRLGQQRKTKVVYKTKKNISFFLACFLSYSKSFNIHNFTTIKKNWVVRIAWKILWMLLIYLPSGIENNYIHSFHFFYNTIKTNLDNFGYVPASLVVVHGEVVKTPVVQIKWAVKLWNLQ